MPTFQSINFSRELAPRLVAISEKGDVNPVETPQALLSRHPLSLRLKNKDNDYISTYPIHCIGFPETRKEVADKMVAHSLPGQRHTMFKTLIQQHQQQWKGEDEDEQLVRVDSSSSSYLSSSSPLSPGLVFHGSVTALDMLKYQRAMTIELSTERIVNVSTGSIALDTLLGMPRDFAAALSSCMSQKLCIPIPVEGLPWGHIIQCSGQSGCGKTQLALAIATSSTVQECPAIYICSSVGQGCLRPLATRFRKLAITFSETTIQLKKLMDRISFEVVEDGYQLLACLAEIENGFLLASRSSQQHKQKAIPSTPPPPRLIILDAASGILTTEDETFLQRVALRLKHLARHYHAIVWINNASMMPSTGHKTSNINNSLSNGTPLKPKVALGSSWKSVFDIHLSLDKVDSNIDSSTSRRQSEQLQQQQQKEVIRATLESHPWKQCSKESMTAEFCITAKGIQDYQPLFAGSGEN